jgi:phosphatidylglycerophosphate synthase
MRWIKKLQEEVRASVRIIEVEERFDLLFSRPLGLFFAKIAFRLNRTPTQVSVASLLTGVVGGVLFLWQNDPLFAVSGAFLVIVAGILDSSDGQLARMTQSSTELGRIIDGIVDNLVFISVYVCSAFYLVDSYGWIVSFGIASAAGYAHSLKSAVYEFHKSEYFYYVGRYETNRIPYAEEVRRTYPRDTLFQKFVYHSYLDYCRKQEKDAFRPPPVREQLKALAFNDETRNQFLSLYQPLNQKMLFWWAWTGGSNIQRNAMLIAILLGYVEVYFVLNSLSLAGHFAVGRLQQKTDDELLNTLSTGT